MTDDEPKDAALQRLFVLDERHGPATRLDATQASRAIQQALDEWQAPVRSVVPLHAASRRWQTWAMAAAVLLACMATARALYVWVAAKTAETTDAKPQGMATSAVHSVDEPRPESLVPQEISPSREQPAIDQVVIPKRVRVTDVDHLARANRLRADGRYADAVRAYQRVIASDDAGSAYVAHVAAASLLLEHLNDPGRARTLFVAARALQPNGALEREITQGLAACDRR